MNKPKNIPELRFPEFANEGEWEEKRIDDIANIVASGDLDYSSFSLEPTETHIYPVYSNSISKEGLYGYNNYHKFKPNSVTITARGTLGVAFVRKTEFIGIGRLLVVSDLNNTDAVFLKENWNHFAKIPLENGGIPQLTAVKAKSVTLLFAKEKEQQKIASCLSSLDELIATHNQKLDILKDHKKGLMQNLFPQEGEKVPTYRFPEFEKDGEWVEKTIGQVYNFKVTNSLSREYLNYEKGKVKNIHYGDIHTKFNTLFDIEKEIVPYINEEVSIQKIKKESYCIEGDIVFADASEDLNDVGKSIEIVNLNNEKLISGSHTLLARQRKNKLIIGFGGYLFKSDWVRKQIQREAQGAKVLGVSATRISSVKILYPIKPQEQQKIASCLSALDTLITAQADKIEQLKQHKKGLMQGLFPNATA